MPYETKQWVTSFSLQSIQYLLNPSSSRASKYSFTAGAIGKWELLNTFSLSSFKALELSHTSNAAFNKSVGSASSSPSRRSCCISFFSSPKSRAFSSSWPSPSLLGDPEPRPLSGLVSSAKEPRSFFSIETRGCWVGLIVLALMSHSSSSSLSLVKSGCSSSSSSWV